MVALLTERVLFGAMTTLMTDTRLCPRCFQEKPLDDFGVWGEYRGTMAGKPRTYCRSCERAFSKDGYEKRKLQAKVVEEQVEAPVASETLGKRLGFAICPHGECVEIYMDGESIFIRESRD